MKWFWSVISNLAVKEFRIKKKLFIKAFDKCLCNFWQMTNVLNKIIFWLHLMAFWYSLLLSKHLLTLNHWGFENTHTNINIELICISQLFFYKQIYHCNWRLKDAHSSISFLWKSVILEETGQVLIENGKVCWKIIYFP